MLKNKITSLRILPILLLLLASPMAKASEGAAPEQMNIIQTILHGGPLIVMIWLCILGTSMVMITFIIQLFLTLRKEAFAPKALTGNCSIQSRP